ncbi:FecR family protein [Chitinophaga vietnamensis]|uniref:FecR family protein n=1 Tax=Chitinophaga vietnamensis TaxID=2593957 RepID=UPI00117839C3|nr:FecR domain-containing protein [Chitinophaga vietnamensis]
MAVSRLRYLFERYYDGRCTTEEQQEFMLLVEQSASDDELRELLDERLLNAADSSAMPDDIADNILKRIMQTNAPGPRRLYTWKRAAIAACVASLLCVAAYKLFMPHKKETNPVAASMPLPGHKSEHARLVLGNGEVVDLEQHKGSSVNIQAGLAASHHGNELAYNNSQTITPTINTVYTNKGGTYRVILPDGTAVWLNAASSLRFPTAFNDSTREVTLQGEAYFEVAARSNQPFFVKTKGMKIAVLGTRFNVMSYEDENNSCTSLLEGAINIISGTVVKRMAPGQQALVAYEHNNIRISNADVEAAIAWKEGRFEFNGNISSIMRELARWYDLQVVFEGKITNNDYAGSFSRNDRLEDILRQLELTGSIHFNIKNNVVTVSP